MTKVKKIFESKEEIAGKHLLSNEWIWYSGILTIYDRSKNSVTLTIKSEFTDSILSMMLDDKKTFTADSITQVYAKLVKWFYKRDVVFG